jgi:hypothetical protein
MMPEGIDILEITMDIHIMKVMNTSTSIVTNAVDAVTAVRLVRPREFLLINLFGWIFTPWSSLPLSHPPLFPL